MTVGTLCNALAMVAERNGWECLVRIIDDEGEWPFSIHVEDLHDAAGTRRVVYLDVTGEPGLVVTEPETPPPDATDFQPANGSS